MLTGWIEKIEEEVKPVNEDVELAAKLKLDTSDAERQLNQLTSKASKVSKTTAQQIKLPAEATKSLKDIFSGDKGLANIGKLAKSATTGVNGFTGALMGMSRSAGTAALAIGGVAAALAVITKLLQGTDTMQMIADKAAEVFDELRATLAPLLSQLGDLVVVVLQIVKDLLPLIEPAVTAIAFALKPIVNLLNQIEPAIQLLGKTLQTFYDIVKDVVKAITFGLVDLRDIMGTTTVTVQRGYSTSLDKWETSGETADEKLADAGDTLSDAGRWLEDVAATLKATFEDAFSGVKNMFVKIKDGIVDAGKGAWENIKDTASKAWTNISTNAAQVASNVGEIASNIWEGVKTAAATVGSVAVSTATNVWSSATSVASKIGETVKNAFKKLKFWANGGTLDAGAQIWGMNERGNPEFLFNSGGTDTVVNAEILERAMYNAVKRANAEGMTRIEIAPKSGTPIGPKALADWLLPSLQFNLARR